MKKIIFILFTLLAAGVSAQEGSNRYEKIRALKTAYITEQLELTSSEAERFWPVYNRFEEQFHKVWRQKRTEVYQKLKSGSKNLSDSEANTLLDRNLALEREELELLKQRTAALREIISPQKVIGLKKAEDDFKRQLLDRYRKQQRNRGK